MENPYSPPQTAALPALPVISQLDITGPPICFSGTLTRRDIARALGVRREKVVGTIFFWIMIVFTIGLSATSLITAGTQSGVSMLVLGLFAPLALFAYRQSGWSRARRYIKASPKTLEHQQGTITAHRIRVESHHGWGDVYWSAICGVDLRQDQLTLALNPQHLAFIFLHRRHFSEADWNRLVLAVLQVAPALPFVPRAHLVVDHEVMTSAEVPELGEVPPDSILLHGTLTSKDVLEGPVGNQLRRKSVTSMVVAVVVVALVLWAIGAGELFGYYLWLLLAIPVYWLYRLYRTFSFADPSQHRPILKIRAAASDSMLRMATPRGSMCVYWSAFSDVIVGENLLCLRETRSSPTMIPLCRSTLVDPQQWNQLVELVTRKVSEDEPAGVIEAQLVTGADTAL